MRVYQFRHVGTAVSTLLKYQALTFSARSTFVAHRGQRTACYCSFPRFDVATVAEETEIIADDFQ